MLEFSPSPPPSAGELCLRRLLLSSPPRLAVYGTVFFQVLHRPFPNTFRFELIRGSGRTVSSAFLLMLSEIRLPAPLALAPDTRRFFSPTCQ